MTDPTPAIPDPPAGAPPLNKLGLKGNFLGLRSMSDLDAFLKAAQAAGLSARLASLAAEIDLAIADYPANADVRYLRRLTDQQRRLANPDLDLVVAVTAQLCQSDPASRERIVPLAKDLVERYAVLRRLT